MCGVCVECVCNVCMCVYVLVCCDVTLVPQSQHSLHPSQPTNHITVNSRSEGRVWAGACLHEAMHAPAPFDLGK